MKKLFFLFIFLLQSQVAANIAMPGFFSSGGGGTLSPSKSNQEHPFLQMKKEEIKINLYNDFAVVRGEYEIYNHHQEKMIEEIAFPKLGMSEGKILVTFGAVEKFKVLSNAQEISYSEDENWFRWKNIFVPGNNRIIVYYLSKTDEAYIISGYQRTSENGFVYIVETGAVWKEKIEQGKIIVRMMDELSIESVKGIIPAGKIRTNGKNLISYEFNNLKPSVEDNLIIRYSGGKKETKNKDVFKNPEKYFDLLENQDYYKQETKFFLLKTDFKPEKNFLEKIIDFISNLFS